MLVTLTVERKCLFAQRLLIRSTNYSLMYQVILLAAIQISENFRKKNNDFTKF